jgi:DNA-binding CsgD family transcriptional regulator
MLHNLTAINDLDFTSREIQVIELIQQGLSSKEIAEKLSLSEKTINRHRQNIAQKAGTSGKNGFRKFIKNYPPPYHKIIISIIVIIKSYGRKLVVQLPQKINLFQRTLYQVCKPW